jgi:hypothetical protein
MGPTTDSDPDNEEGAGRAVTFGNGRHGRVLLRWEGSAVSPPPQK